MIKKGGFPFSVFTTLYQACVCSIVDYGGEVFGYNSFDSALKIHLRAARAFLGLAKTTPIPGIISEFNLLLPQYRNHIKMVRQYHRILKMSNDRLTRKVFNWDKLLNDRVQTTWYSEVQNIFSLHNMENIFQSNIIFDLKSTLEKLQKSMLLAQQNSLETQCSAKSKLRTFITFKDFYTTPSYISKPLSFVQRKFMAKIRLGCLEISIETGRYARPRLPEDARICQICHNPGQTPENEVHFLLQCEAYESERSAWLSSLEKPENFSILPPSEKLKIVLNHDQNVKKSAQYIINIYDKRSKIVSNLPNAIQDRNIVYHIFPHDQCPACTALV